MYIIVPICSALTIASNHGPFVVWSAPTRSAIFTVDKRYPADRWISKTVAVSNGNRVGQR